MTRRPAGDRDRVGEVLGALADPTRRAIVGRLAAGATPTATELSRELPMTRQAVSKHLQSLQDAELVEMERRGRESRYRLRPEQLRLAGDWIDEVGGTWEQRLDRLKTIIEHDPSAPH
jgi:DNA-binding transcriptional ArsR family regulator